MLIVSTDVPCAVFDRVQVRITRGSDALPTFDQVFLRADCPATGVSPPPVIPLSQGPGAEHEWRLGIIDGRRTDDRVRVDLIARDMSGQVFSTAAETEFVDDKVYALPVSLAQVCADARTLACPSGQVCRARPDNGALSCGSVYRAPGTFGSFSEPMAAHITVDPDERP